MFNCNSVLIRRKHEEAKRKWHVHELDKTIWRYINMVMSSVLSENVSKMCLIGGPD